MAKNTMDIILERVKEAGWEPISNSYQNLDTVLEFKCDEGHLVYLPWRKGRTKLECPVCKQNKLKDTPNIIKEKGARVKNRILALDQATNTTGFAIFDDKELVTYGIITADSKLTEIARDSQMKEWLISMVSIWGPDVVGLEGIQYQQMVGITTFEKLARLQGILLETCYSLGVETKICHTAVWRKHCGVKGKSRSDKKASMKMVVKKKYDVSLSDDCADAIGIGTYIAEEIYK